ncbi:MAG: D-tyrosyl-tRNA(Tyr) deacylase [Chromatiales bacterium]|nr:D-tyrosyl-tRNA(Tyr) deacylase [Chromatiales bacterium]
MIALLQRVSSAVVEVAGERIATIDAGLLVLVGVERGDTRREAGRLAERVLAYRVFPDAEGRMNLSLVDTAGELLLVPQFTLAADTRRGNRPGFEPAALPEQGRELFEELARSAALRHPRVACGRFGAEMRVSLCNEGPVTFWLQVRPACRATA